MIRGCIRRLTLGLALIVALGAGALAQVPAPSAAQALPVPAAIDRIFERWDRPGSPGCAVGVSRRGQVIYTRGYGMANLEYGVRIRPDSIFESGSVAKQFTAAAIALLAQDGRLSIDDPVRKYVPELPDFGAPILIRHFLNHTSGLRSQWPMLTLAGRPPTMAVHSVAEILELVGHYKELNFKPGEEYLYNNTGFTLLGVIVQRVSGKSLNQFCQERLFGPIGMTRTQWRDDFTKIVEDRTTAYRATTNGQFRTLMPFTNVIGNGGLLTTVADLLAWNENLDNPRVGGQAMVEQLQTRGRLNDGFVNEYAQGLTVTEYKGVREVSHGGSTAGYQTFLARFPDQGLSVAVLCNTTGTNPGAYAHQIADAVLAGTLKERPVVRAIEAPQAALEGMAGVYRERSTDAVLRLVWDRQARQLRIGGQALLPTAPGTLIAQDGSRTISTEGEWPESFDGIRLVESDSRTKPRTWERQQPYRPSAEQLAEFEGAYESEELGVTYVIFTAGGALQVRFRPAQGFALTPVFADAFDGDGNTFRFTRSGGKVDGLRVFAGRARHVRFLRR